MKKNILSVCFIAMILTSAGQKKSGFEVIEQKEKKQVDILYNGKLLTAYCYYDSIMKPFLFPVNTVDGITVTRGYPIDPRPGERTDHPHHTGVWMNYESVNGLDFWNNSTAIATDKKDLYGRIKHEEIRSRTTDSSALLISTADWLHPDGHTILKEKTHYLFSVKNNQFFIDRRSTLTASEPVIFKDVKDGFFAIRVARELELPSKQADIFLDVHGNKTTVPKTDNTGVTGMYYASNGREGDSVWSSQGRWTMLKGKKNGRQITIGIFDHPSNPGYPAYWHARGYGLFAINPLGRKIFSNGKEELNLSLKQSESVTFHYGMIIASGVNITEKIMNQLADDFARK